VVKDDQLVSESIGSFSQYPFRLAFAVTIHKSQGKTFERVLIDVGRGVFAPGQIYVALSRCTSIEGIFLRKPVQKNHIMVDDEVRKFLADCQYRMAAAVLSKEDKIHLLNQAIDADQGVSLVYLKDGDEKIKQAIRPVAVREMSYKGQPFTGLEAYCRPGDEKRIFSLDRILEIVVPSRRQSSAVSDEEIL
jgi:predicted DNA-binding transcriptional regulator YafY